MPENSDSQGEVKKIVLLPRADVEVFERLHPQHGAFTWFMREALRRYVEINNVLPEELVTEAVKDIAITAAVATVDR